MKGQKGHIGVVSLVSLLILGIVGNANAQLVQVGSTATVIGTNSPTDFTQNVTLNGTLQTIDSGLLTFQDTIISAGPNADWLVFDFETTSGGSIAGNINGYWSIQINNIQFTQPIDWTANPDCWTHNEVGFSPLNPFGGFSNVEPNPFDPSFGPVYGTTFNYGPVTTLNNSAFVTPFTFVGAGGIDPNAANGWHFGMLIQAANPATTPEPGDLALLVGAGLSGAGLIARRRLRR
jgi:hypothetical protein